jgi:hypothetical protein
MRNALVAAGAALTFGFVLSASVAAAAPEVTASTCRDLDTQVQSALQSSQATDREQAVREENTARQYCSHGFYKNGAQHYAQALKLLGTKT